MLPIGLILSVGKGFLESHVAHNDREKLAVVLIKNYDSYGTCSQSLAAKYDGKKISTVESAILYARQKIQTRASHLQAAAGVSTAVISVSTAVGGIGGSVVPGAGTVVAGGVGAAIGYGLSKGIVYSARAVKNLSKRMAGTLGVHRDQATFALAIAVEGLDATDADQKAAIEAISVILGKRKFNKLFSDQKSTVSWNELFDEIKKSLSSWKTIALPRRKRS